MSAQRTAVLITGTSTGIGRACALRFARDGYRVFAGVLNPSDAGEIENLRGKAYPDIRAVRIDVTSDESVRAAAALVLAQSDGPLILINNAGIVKSGPLEFLTMAELREQFEVNLVGVLRVTQPFLPRMREHGGRIVNVGSSMGRISWPFSGAYSSSKFALEGLSESLRHELAPFGIPVTVIEPGVVATAIWRKSGIEDGSAASQIRPATEALYGKRIRKLQAVLQRVIRTAEKPETVAGVVAKLCRLKRPPMRVLIGKGARIQITLRALLPFALWEKIVGLVV